MNLLRVGTETVRAVARSGVQLTSVGWRFTGVRNALAFIGSVAVVLGTTVAVGSTGAEAASPADLGVTSTTIRVGFPVIDFAALAAVGVHLNDGNFQDAISALTAYMNKHGGIDDRKIVPYVTLDNPANTTSGTTNCSQLTEDDHVFVVILPVYPDCYQVTHDTPVIDGTLPGTLPANAAPDFSLTPPDTAYDPIELAALSKKGVFKGKKVGVYYGTGIDAPEARAVEADLKKLHVDVDQVAGAFAPATDTVAVDQQTETIALKFKNDGVNEVISVGGSGPTDWARGLNDIESTYKPPWIATSVTALGSEVAAAKGNEYLDNSMTASPLPTAYEEWHDPAIQKCYATVHKAFPSDPIAPPANPNGADAAANGSNDTYAAVESTCQNLAILSEIADRAGKNLTVASFTKAGYGLRNVTFPGSGGPVSFGPNQPYAIGKTNILVYSTKLGTLVDAPARQH
jgi:hypothetical protein